MFLPKDYLDTLLKEIKDLENKHESELTKQDLERLKELSIELEIFLKDE